MKNTFPDPEIEKDVRQYLIKNGFLDQFAAFVELNPQVKFLLDQRGETFEEYIAGFEEGEYFYFHVLMAVSWAILYETYDLKKKDYDDGTDSFQKIKILYDIIKDFFPKDEKTYNFKQLSDDITEIKQDVKEIKEIVKALTIKTDNIKEDTVNTFELLRNVDYFLKNTVWTQFQELLETVLQPKFEDLQENIQESINQARETIMLRIEQFEENVVLSTELQYRVVLTFLEEMLDIQLIAFSTLSSLLAQLQVVLNSLAGSFGLFTASWAYYRTYYVHEILEGFKSLLFPQFEELVEEETTNSFPKKIKPKGESNATRFFSRTIGPSTN
uniref:Uncharacterized protein n=1 Tax=Glaucocystis incrassata TaxID=1789788 RepID=A0A3G1IVR2_9EUKA|nr:hypothetical protein [Glaucocystis incrassata]ASQ40019.1 hypothetical protein [Glaucocystis incrassata]